MARRRLSQRQIERIRAIQERRRAKLETRTESSLAASDDEEAREGMVVARHGANLAVADDSGRIHHCLSRQNIGHPVCGDTVYRAAHGSEPIADDSNAPRLALHACRLALSHPQTGERLTFESPLPWDLQRLVDEATGDTAE